MPIDIIRTWFIVVYAHLCAALNLPILDDIWITYTDRVPVRAAACVWMNGIYPRVGISEYAISTMSIYDICQLLAHEALHICIWQMGKDYSDNSAVFIDACDKLGIFTNKCHKDNLFDFTQLLKE